MANLNVKTDPARKGKTITGAVMTLTAAAVVAMAPMSEAFAGYFSTQGTGKTKAKAEENARHNAKKRCDQWGKKFGQRTKQVTHVSPGTPWKDAKNTWHMPLEFDCIYY